MYVATNEHCVASNDVFASKTESDESKHSARMLYPTSHNVSFTNKELTCVGLAFSFGKFIFDGFNCNVDGLHGVGGSRRP